MEEKLDNPAEFDLGKKNIELMEKLVEELTEEGEYVATKRVKTE